jgi:hypothetical protein
MRFGVPYTESTGSPSVCRLENNTLELGDNAPQRFKDYVAIFGESSTALLGQ